MATQLKDEMEATAPKAGNYLNTYINYLPVNFQERAVSIFKKNNVKVVKVEKAQKEELPISVNVILKKQLPCLPSAINTFEKQIEPQILITPIETEPISKPLVNRIRVRRSEELLEKPPDTKPPPSFNLETQQNVTKWKFAADKELCENGQSNNVTIIRGDLSEMHNDQLVTLNNQSYPISIIKVEREGMGELTNLQETTRLTKIKRQQNAAKRKNNVAPENTTSENKNDKNPAVLQFSPRNKIKQRRQLSTIEKLQQTLQEQKNIIQQLETKIGTRNKRICDLKFTVKELHSKYINLKKQAREANFYKSSNSPEVVDIVCKLYGISPQAYELVKKHIDKSLPAPLYIKKKLLPKRKSLVSNTIVEKNVALKDNRPSVIFYQNNNTTVNNVASLSLDSNVKF